MPFCEANFSYFENDCNAKLTNNEFTECFLVVAYILYRMNIDGI